MAANRKAGEDEKEKDLDLTTGNFVLIKKGSTKTYEIFLEKVKVKNFKHPATMWEPKSGDSGKNIIDAFVSDPANEIKDDKEGLIALTEGDLDKSKKFMEEADKFFKKENNAIVRSFNSTKGRGLAGFISSMAFDYSDATWATDQGSRAPKSVGITLAFTPVHDVPVGMDYQGKLRGLSHPTGKIIRDTNTFPNVNLVDNFGDVYSGEEEGAAPDDAASYDKVVETLEKVARRGFDPPSGPGLGI
jgi:hypothetical protein